MPKSPSKAELLERLPKLETQNFLMSRYISDTLNGVQPDAVETVEHEGRTYRYQLFRAVHAHGGYLVCIENDPGINKQFSICYFDNFLADTYNSGRYFMCNVKSRLNSTRYRLLGL